MEYSARAFCHKRGLCSLNYPHLYTHRRVARAPCKYRPPRVYYIYTLLCLSHHTHSLCVSPHCHKKNCAFFICRHLQALFVFLYCRTFTFIATWNKKVYFFLKKKNTDFLSSTSQWQVRRDFKYKLFYLFFVAQLKQKKQNKQKWNKRKFFFFYSSE